MTVRIVTLCALWLLSVALSLLIVVSAIAEDWHILTDYGFEVVALLWLIALLTYLKFVRAESRNRKANYKRRLNRKIMKEREREQTRFP